MLMRTYKTAMSLVTIIAVMVILVSYNFMSAAWTNPTATPPNNNTDAPVNIGASAQDKAGNFGASGLVAFGNNVTVTNAAPQIAFDDTSTDNNTWWLHSNAYSGSKGRIHFLYDRNNNGSWDAGDYPTSMYIESGATAAEDYVYFSNQVRAGQYCDQNGANCFIANDVNGTAVGGSKRLYYDGSANADTLIPDTASCALTGMNNGGCDSGFRCSISPSGGTWHVDQTNNGDCDRTPSCEYNCTNVSGICTVKIDAVIQNEAKTAITMSDSRTVTVKQGTLPRIGGWVDCNSTTHNGYFTDLVLSDPTPNATQLGWWTEATFTSIKPQFDTIQWKSSKPFSVQPGVTESLEMWNGCARVHPKITATVISCP
jgi:hypothetical protein